MVSPLSCVNKKKKITREDYLIYIGKHIYYNKKFNLLIRNFRVNICAHKYLFLIIIFSYVYAI